MDLICCNEVNNEKKIMNIMKKGKKKGSCAFLSSFHMVRPNSFNPWDNVKACTVLV